MTANTGAQNSRPTADNPSLAEQGRDAEGRNITSERRLYMQLLAFGDVNDTEKLIQAVEYSGIHGTLYMDVNDPRGVAFVTAHTNPDFFVNSWRTFLNRSPFAELTIKHEYTMLGRTYAIGYESDLEHILINRPLHRICNPDWPWAVWYPLRRSGMFEKLPKEEQRDILMEHGRQGAEFSAAGHGYDIRLACHGLDRNDNDFVVALVGPELHPLSAMVQAMRKTRQTSEFLTNLGPFLVGKIIWHTPFERYLERIL